MTQKEYRALPALSASDIKIMQRSQAHWHYWKSNPPEETEAQRLGTAVHMKILQPDLFDSEYALFSDSAYVEALRKGEVPDESGKHKAYENPRASKLYKSYKADFDNSVQGRKIIGQEYLEVVNGISNAVKQNPHVNEWLNDPQSLKEHAIFWRVGDTDMKAMLDLICGHVIVDIKTTLDARADSFMREAHRYGYFLQGAVYVSALESTGIENPTFILLACEKEPPYLCQPFVIGQDTIEYQKTRIDKLLREHVDCLRTGIWSGYKIDPVMLEMPIYALKEEDGE